MHCNDSYDWFYLHAHKLGSDDWSYMSPGKGGMPMMRGEQVSWVLSAGTLEGGCYISYSENAVPIEIEWFHVYSTTRFALVTGCFLKSDTRVVGSRQLGRRLCYAYIFGRSLWCDDWTYN